MQAKTEVRFPLEKAALAMALHRILELGSKRHTHPLGGRPSTGPSSTLWSCRERGWPIS